MGTWVSDPKPIREFPGVSDQGSVREFIDFSKIYTTLGTIILYMFIYDKIGFNKL